MAVLMRDRKTIAVRLMQFLRRYHRWLPRPVYWHLKALESRYVRSMLSRRAPRLTIWHVFRIQTLQHHQNTNYPNVAEPTDRTRTSE